MCALLVYCRGGFEKDGIAELNLVFATSHGPLVFKAVENSSYCVVAAASDKAFDPSSLEVFPHLVFARQVVLCSEKVTELPATDRASPLAQMLLQFFQKNRCNQEYFEVFVESPDTNEGKALHGFCQSFQRPFEAALARLGFIKSLESGQRIHVFFENGSAARVGVSLRDHSSPHLNGIPRLRFPSTAPSRSTLKLDEAFLTLMTESERHRYLKPDMGAIDLGAAPGGWTYQFVRRKMAVTAVDNGALDSKLMDSGRVKHIRANGLKYVPQEATDWMVCDMIETPKRVVEVAARWLCQGWCRASVVTLKLPMKKRCDEVQSCIVLLRDELEKCGLEFTLRCKQLYHNREEVTLLAIVTAR